MLQSMKHSTDIYAFKGHLKDPEHTAKHVAKQVKLSWA